VYIHQIFGPLVAYRIGAAGPDSKILSQTNPTVDSMFAGIAISADGVNSGAAIVWQTTGDVNKRQSPGTLHAFDATDLSRELWTVIRSPRATHSGALRSLLLPRW